MGITRLSITKIITNKNATKELSSSGILIIFIRLLRLFFKEEL